MLEGKRLRARLNVTATGDAVLDFKVVLLTVVGAFVVVTVVDCIVGVVLVVAASVICLKQFLINYNFNKTENSLFCTAFVAFAFTSWRTLFGILRHFAFFGVLTSLCILIFVNSER